MSGNVWEWLVTEYESKYSNDFGNRKVRSLRGGSSSCNPSAARVTYRYGNGFPASRSEHGFRLACSVPV